MLLFFLSCSRIYHLQEANFDLKINEENNPEILTYHGRVEYYGKDVIKGNFIILCSEYFFLFEALTFSDDILFLKKIEKNIVIHYDIEKNECIIFDNCKMIKIYENIILPIDTRWLFYLLIPKLPKFVKPIKILVDNKKSYFLLLYNINDNYTLKYIINRDKIEKIVLLKNDTKEFEINYLKYKKKDGIPYPSYIILESKTKDKLRFSIREIYFNILKDEINKFSCPKSSKVQIHYCNYE